MSSCLVKCLMTAAPCPAPFSRGVWQTPTSAQHGAIQGSQDRALGWWGASWDATTAPAPDCLFTDRELACLEQGLCVWQNISKAEPKDSTPPLPPPSRKMKLNRPSCFRLTLTERRLLKSALRISALLPFQGSSSKTTPDRECPVTTP